MDEARRGIDSDVGTTNVAKPSAQTRVGTREPWFTSLALARAGARALTTRALVGP